MHASTFDRQDRTRRQQALATLSADRHAIAEAFRADRRARRGAFTPPRPSRSALATAIRDRGIRPGGRVSIPGRAMQRGRELAFVRGRGSDQRLTRLGYVAHVATAARLEQAAQEWIARKTRRTHPLGTFDRAGRWYPHPIEECPHSVRPPSRRWTYSYLTHCRSQEHVAWLYSVDVRDLRRRIRELQQ